MGNGLWIALYEFFQDMTEKVENNAESYDKILIFDIAFLVFSKRTSVRYQKFLMIFLLLNIRLYLKNNGSVQEFI